jgi:RimJ/RimL family protein N-acetyltransferase
VLLVYQLHDAPSPADLYTDEEVKWTFADRCNVKEFFSDNERKRTFIRFLDKQAIGLILHRRSSWMTYAWMTSPSSEPPPHLPRWVRDLDVFWIFYCRTNDSFRGRGLYRLAMSLLIERARKVIQEARIFIDTAPSNIPSRRAILSVGFKPKGVIVSYRFRLPKVNNWVWGHWLKSSQHPSMCQLV